MSTDDKRLALHQALIAYGLDASPASHQLVTHLNAIFESLAHNAHDCPALRPASPIGLCPHCAHYHRDTCRHLAPGETDPCGCAR